MDEGVDLREDHHHLVAIGRGGSKVEVQDIGAGVGIGGRGVDIGIIVDGAGGIVVADPAVGQRSGAAGGIAFEVVEGREADGTAEGVEIGST